MPWVIRSSCERVPVRFAIDAAVHNFTLRAFAQYPTDLDAFYCQPCDKAWGWASVDQLAADDLMQPSAPPPQLVPTGARSFGCCEKSTLNRGMSARMHGIEQLGGCFRDWETPASGLVKHHQKMPN